MPEQKDTEADRQATSAVHRHAFEVIEGGEKPTTVWDAKAEVALGIFIARYLAENPPPDTSRFARDLDRWANRLLEDGRARLADFGERLLTAAAQASEPEGVA